MDRSDLTAFWSLPPSTLDWHNLTVSGIGRVMLPYSVASLDLLSSLADIGKRVVIRLTPDDLAAHSYNDIRDYLAACQRKVRVDAIIGPNEPEVAYDLTFDAPDWHQTQAYDHKRQAGALFLALAPLGIPLVSPPWSHHGVGLGETDQLYPGLFTWREICAGVYHWYAGCGVHAYTHNWLGPVDETRLKQAIRFWASFWHKPIWIDEIGVRNGPEDQRVRGYLNVARWLCLPDNPAGGRVKMLAPFIFNGDPGRPPRWDPGFLIRQQASYEAIGQFMRGG